MSTSTRQDQKVPDQNCPEDTKTFLDKVGVLIITFVIIILLTCMFVVLVSIKPSKINTSLNFKLDSVHIEQVDTTFVIANKEFIKSLNQKIDSLKIETTKLAEIKSDIEDSQKKNEDYFKLILALVGSVFAIVGFFGFKSISDTRQATLDAAKIKAETVAENSAKAQAESTVRSYLREEGEQILNASAAKTAAEVAKVTATEISINTASKTATDIANQEANKYFGDQKEFQKAAQQDIDFQQKELNVLRSRIIELETIIFGSDAGDTDQTATGTTQEQKDPVV